MILPLFLHIFYPLLFIAEQCHRNFNRLFETYGRPWNQLWPPTLENSFGELGEDKIVVRKVYGTGVCHGPSPVVENNLSLRIDT